MIKEKCVIWSKISAGLGVFFARYLSLPAIFYTILSLFSAMFAAFCAYQHAFVVSILLFLVANFLDILDGAVARAQKKASALGAFLDGTTDRFIDFAMIYSYFFFPVILPYLDIGQWLMILSFVVIMPTFIVAYANHRRAVDDDNETLIWRIMNRGEMSVLLLSAFVVSLFNAVWSGYLLILLVVLSIITIIQTIAETVYHARKANI